MGVSGWVWGVCACVCVCFVLFCFVFFKKKMSKNGAEYRSSLLLVQHEAHAMINTKGSYWSLLIILLTFNIEFQFSQNNFVFV